MDVGAARPLEAGLRLPRCHFDHILLVNASQKATRFKDRRKGEVAQSYCKGVWQGPLQLSQKTGLFQGPSEVRYGLGWGLPMIHFIAGG